MIRRALLGVSDRTGLIEVAQALLRHQVELIATDGTRAALAQAGIEARAVSDLTRLPEMLDGRVKTIHSAIAAGILARRDRAEHMAQLEEHGFVPIDCVIVNLYPFREALASGAAGAELIEKIDIGGPTLIRAAAKNADAVAVLVSPEQYSELITALDGPGDLSIEQRRRLAAEAFRHVAAYDTAVADRLQQDAGLEPLGPDLSVGGRRISALRYGENPHQHGALYGIAGATGVANASQLQGPALSFTNWLDVDAAWQIVNDFEQPAAVVIKHTNPCGMAVADTVEEAYRQAYACDPRSAFGGIVGLNRPLTAAGVAALGKTFLEAVIAPAVDADARALLASRERLRVLEAPERPGPQLDVRSVSGGLLVQTGDRVGGDRERMTVMTSSLPDETLWPDLLQAWRLCRFVKSNAIVVVSGGRAVGVGAGQMSRVEAAELAVQRAGERAHGAVAASDAFFPMPDGVETLARAGIRAVIQPGGSRKDPEVVAAADSLGVAMVAAGERHFRH